MTDDPLPTRSADSQRAAVSTEVDRHFGTADLIVEDDVRPCSVHFMCPFLPRCSEVGDVGWVYAVDAQECGEGDAGVVSRVPA